MKKMYILFFCFILFFSGCAQKVVEDTVMPDDADTTGIALVERPQIVLALSSSIAEIWLLAGGKLDGVTSDAVTDRNLGLAEDIKIIGTVKDPNTEAILAEEPDLVLLSPDISSHRDIAEILDNTGVPYYMAKVETLNDYLTALKDFTTMTGDKDAYERNGKKVEEEVERLLSRAQDNYEYKTALFLRAYSSGVKAIASDHTVCYILEDIGVQNIAQSDTSLLEDLSIEAILASDPDYIFIVTMGSSESDAIASLEQSLASHPAWGNLSAVNNGNMVILPKELYHYKPNNRWGKAYEELFKIVYP